VVEAVEMTLEKFITVQLFERKHKRRT